MTMLLFAIARILFVVLIPMCNISPMNRRTEDLIPSDVVYGILVALLPMSETYLSTLYFSEAPSQVPERDKELVGNSLVLTFSTGQLCGALSSLIVLSQDS